MKTEFGLYRTRTISILLFLIVMAFVTVIEFINTSGSIHQFHLTGIETDGKYWKFPA